MKQKITLLHFPIFRTTFLLVILSIYASPSHGQQWGILGNETQIASVTSTNTSIALVDTLPYVFYREGTVGKVKRKNPTTGAWAQVGDDIGSNISFGRIHTDKANALYVSYIDAGSSSRLAVKKYNAASNTWLPLGATSNLYISSGTASGNNDTRFSSTPRSSLTFDSYNSPYIAFTDGANLTPYVKKFNGSTWITIGSGPVKSSDTAIGVSLVIDEDDLPWLTYIRMSTPTSTAGYLALYGFSGTTWASVSVPIPLPGGSATTGATSGIRHTNMVLNEDNNLSIAYFNTSNFNRCTVVEYDKTADTWSFSAALSSRDAPNLSLIRDASGNLYCSFIDLVTTTPSSLVRVFKQYPGITGWTELKIPNALAIDSTSGNLAIAIGSDTAKPTIVYTKANSSNIVTPTVRRYGSPNSIGTTISPAIINTRAITAITSTSATTGGNITADGGAAITERGVVYSLNVNPTTANGKVVNGAAGTGMFTTVITGLAPSQFYYVRAYAINATGTVYGDNVRLSTLHGSEAVVGGAKQMEMLSRGVVAVRSNAGKVFISWRYLGTDSAGTGFNLYRDGALLNSAPITTSTNYEDATITNGVYIVKPVLNGVEGTASAPTTVWATNQFSIPIQAPPGGTSPDNVTYTYTANDCSVGDVDGDGEYEIFLKWDPTNSHDNSISGYSGNVFIDCYKMNGTKLWRIDLGRNIRAGAHYTQFMVYDFDGDGKAEMICKTADATVDGAGTVIGNSSADYRNSSGYILTGPEYLTVFNGLTGAAMSTVTFQPARGTASDWGDSYGNRVDRFVSAVAYLDGVHPSAIIGRGYYAKLVRAAYDYRNGQLALRWIFNSETSGNEAYRGQGNHQMTIGDVDGDGKDEICNGSSIINDDGTRYATYRNGHGDALHMSDMDPDRPGQEIWHCLEDPGSYTPLGIRLDDARTGETIFGDTTTGDVGRALAADIDPTHRGYEMWASAGYLYNVQDGRIGSARPTGGSQAVNFGIWWDGDLGRELLDGTIMDKWNYTTNSLNRLFTIYNAAPVSSNNDTKKNPCLMGDLIGDWREEILLRRTDNTALILFTTTIPTDKRIYTLMHNPQYRTAIAWQNSGYNQPPYPSFFLGYDMATPPQPNIYLAGPDVILPVKILSFNATRQDKEVLVKWSSINEMNSSYYVVERSANGREFMAIETINDKGNTGRPNDYSFTDRQPLSGVSYYRLKQVDADGKFSYTSIRTIHFPIERQLVLYPNPASTAIKMTLQGNTENLTVRLANVEGILIYQGKGSLTKINAAVNQLLPTLKSGYYSVVVSGMDGVYKAQLIKQQ